MHSADERMLRIKRGEVLPELGRRRGGPTRGGPPGTDLDAGLSSQRLTEEPVAGQT